MDKAQNSNRANGFIGKSKSPTSVFQPADSAPLLSICRVSYFPSILFLQILPFPKMLAITFIFL